MLVTSTGHKKISWERRGPCLPCCHLLPGSCSAFPFLERFPPLLPSAVSELPAHPKPQPASSGRGRRGQLRHSFPGERNCRQMFAAQLCEGLGVKRDLHVPLELLAPDPNRALSQSWVSLEGRDVPGDVWQVLVPVLWGFIGLAELEPHPERCIPSIPKSPMAPHALGKEDANPTPSWHPRPPHQSLSISSPGLHRRDIPAGIQLPAISGSKAPNGKAALGTQLQFPFISASDCHGNRCQRDGAAQHPTPHRDTRDEAFPRCKLTTSQPRENLDLQTPSSSLPQSCSWL